MGDRDLTVYGLPGSQWARGQLEWGCGLPFGRTRAGMSANGGTGEVGRFWSMGQLFGDGPPVLYEVRFSPLWDEAPVRPPGTGLLKAQVTVGVGAARHKITCDCELGQALVLPAGIIGVDIYQTGTMARALDSVNVSIARAMSSKTGATDSYVYQGTPTGATFTFGGPVPAHAVGVKLTAWRILGNHAIRFLDQFANIIAEYDTGTDPELVGRQGVPVPRGAVTFSFIYPNTVVRPPVVSWLLDC